MTVAERTALIARYAAGVREIEDALAGFPADAMTAHPIAGKWSAREILHHLGDSESSGALRLRRLLAQDHAILDGYDQDAWAVRLRYNERDHAPALDTFRSVRANTLPLLQSLTEEDWKRAGWHSESGAYSPERWLEIYGVHAHGHADQIRRLREALGRE
jgi:hypothetical protein